MKRIQNFLALLILLFLPSTLAQYASLNLTFYPIFFQPNAPITKVLLPSLLIRIDVLTGKVRQHPAHSRLLSKQSSSWHQLASILAWIRDRELRFHLPKRHLESERQQRSWRMAFVAYLVLRVCSSFPFYL